MSVFFTKKHHFQTTAQRHTLAFLAGLVVLISLAILWKDFRVDDAYITYRYASNLAHGYGPVFNIGERVEGYTSVVWMWLMGGVAIWNGNLLLASKILGLILGGVVLWGMMRITLLFHVHWISYTFAALLLGTSLPFILYLNSGLETVLFACIITLGTYGYTLFIHKHHPSTVYTLALGLFWGFGVLVRPEVWLFGPVFYFISESLLIYHHRVQRQQWDIRSLLFRMFSFLAGFCVVAGLHLLWRWSFYGSLLPNTYVAKMGSMALTNRLRHGTHYLLQSLHNTPALLLLVASWMLAGKTIWKRSEWLLLNSIVLVALAAVVLEGGDWMPGTRFMVHFLPIIFLLFTISASIRLQGASNAPLRSRMVSAGLIALLLNVLPHVTQRPKIEDYLHNLQYRTVMATWLVNTAPKNATIAYGDMGIVPYTMMDTRFVDVFGLTDKTVARHKKESQTVATYVLGQKPDIILMVAIDAEYPVKPQNIRDLAFAHPYKPLAVSGEFWQQYRFVRSFPSFAQNSPWLERARTILVFERISDKKP